VRAGAVAVDNMIFRFNGHRVRTLFLIKVRVAGVTAPVRTAKS